MFPTFDVFQQVFSSITEDCGISNTDISNRIYSMKYSILNDLMLYYTNIGVVPLAKSQT